jgi:hypothetical protein
MNLEGNMTHIIAKTALIAGLSVSLSGCVQIGSFGKSMWGHTKYAANYVASPVVNLLRSTPRQDYVFEAMPDSQMAAKTAFAGDGRVQKRRGLIVPDLARLPEPQRPHYKARDYQQFYPTAPEYAPEYAPAYAPAQMAEAAPNSTDDISFVKIGGGSNMNDWLSCEAEAGGFIRVTQNGYLVDPGFESCMRAKGYKPESEAAAELNL